VVFLGRAFRSDPAVTCLATSALGAACLATSLLLAVVPLNALLFAATARYLLRYQPHVDAAASAGASPSPPAQALGSGRGGSCPAASGDGEGSDEESDDDDGSGDWLPGGGGSIGGCPDGDGLAAAAVAACRAVLARVPDEAELIHRAIANLQPLRGSPP
jgi:hypothetical protein